MKKDASLDYKIYQTLIESDLTDDQKQYLVEIGLGQMLKSVWGGIKAIPASVADVFKSGMYNVQLVAAQENIKKEVDELRKIGQKLGKGDEFVNEFLYAIMKGAGLNPSAVGSAGGAAAATGPQGSTLAPGTKISASDNDALIKAFTQILSNITGKPTEEVQQQAQEKKVNATTMSSVVAKQAAEKTGVSSATIQKVVSALIKTGHLATEGARHRNEGSILIERWQNLAGIISEGPAANKLANELKTGKIRNTSDLESTLQGYEPFALDDIEKNEQQITQAVAGNPAFTGFSGKFEKILKDAKSKSAAVPQGSAAFKLLSKRIADGTIKSTADLEKARKKYSQEQRPSEEELSKLMDALIGKKEATPQEKEKEVQAAKQDAGAPEGKAGKASPEQAKKAKDALKKFASAASDVRKEVPDIDDATLGMILNYFDELENIKIT